MYSVHVRHTQSVQSSPEYLVGFRSVPVSGLAQRNRAIYGRIMLSALLLQIVIIIPSVVRKQVTSAMRMKCVEMMMHPSNRRP